VTEIFRELSELLSKSGFVGPPLVAGALLLWFGLGYRFVLLFVGTRGDARTLVKAAADGRLRSSGVLAEAAREGVDLARKRRHSLSYFLDELFYDFESDLRKFSPLTQTVVRIAPLMGLLGTVSGMIETFDNLGDTSSGANQGAGVAGGISEALFSTQMGLLVAIPGLLIGRLLDRKAQVMTDELEKMKEVLQQEDLQEAQTGGSS
jgi:biopolymer transport protein ExbB